MGDIPDIKSNLPLAMTMSAFVGISCYIGAEINISLFMRFKRRRGLYFWSCSLCSWGVILQPLFIILADFGVWTDLKGSITMIYLTWLIMVVPQSWVLYSRLHLIMHKAAFLRWVSAILIFNSVVFSVPTIIMGTIAQATDINPNLLHVNTVWDRLQTTVFFVQETALSLLYIWQARKLLGNTALLQRSMNSSMFQTAADRMSLLQQLIAINLIIVVLDIALLGIQYADQFYLQGAFKPSLYGIKLKMEFVILNRLIQSIQTRGKQTANPMGGNLGNASADSGKRTWWSRLVKPTSQTDRGETLVSENVGLENLGGDPVHRLDSHDPIMARLGGDVAGNVDGRYLPPVHWQQYGIQRNDVWQ